jgi:hypothetical protein
VGTGLDPEEGLGAEDNAGAGGPDDEPFAGDIEPDVEGGGADGFAPWGEVVGGVGAVPLAGGVWRGEGGLWVHGGGAGEGGWLKLGLRLIRIKRE